MKEPTARGEVLQSVQSEDLQFIASKLSMMEVDRIAITFLHSHANPANELMASEYFESQGFKTYCSHTFATTFDEAKRWNSCLLNLCLSEHFDRTKDEIFSHSFKNIPIEEIFFVNAKGEFFQESSEWILSSLYSQIHLIKSYTTSRVPAPIKDSDYGILYLGLEDFLMIDPKEMANEVPTFLGNVDLELPKHEKIKTQPTSGISIAPWRDIVFSKQGKGYEPLPVSFEGGSQLVFLDLVLNHPDLQDSIPKILKAKKGSTENFEKALETLTTQVPSWKNISLEEATRLLFQFAVKKIFIESHIGGGYEKLILVGPLAPLIFKEAEPMGLSNRFHLLEQDQTYIDSQSIVNLVSTRMGGDE